MSSLYWIHMYTCNITLINTNTMYMVYVAMVTTNTIDPSTPHTSLPLFAHHSIH